jgi:putative ABC transport system permease protein
VNNLWRDIRFGFRLLFKNTSFTSVAILALALGIGANTAIYSIVYATLIAPLPYHDPSQLVIVWSKIQGNHNVVSAGDFLDWKNQNSVFQGIAAWTGTSINLATAGRPEMVDAQAGTPGFITTIGLQLQLGRDFLPEEGEVGKDHVAILTNTFWKERFNSDRNIVGKSVQMNGEPFTIVGVLAPGPADRGQPKIDVPLAFKPDQINHDFHWLLVLARLKPGVSLAQAQSNMDAVTKHISEVYPKSDQGWGAYVEPLQNDFLDKDVIRALWLLLGAVGFVLLIACANVANLSLARGTARQKEVAVRASVGATRGQLFRQFLMESLALSLLGGLCGVALAWGLLRIIVYMIPRFTLPTEADIRISVPILLFTLGASLIAGVLFGCAPAWQAARMNLSDVLKEGGRSGSSSGRHGLRRTLVVAEFALALSLLAGGGLAIHSLWNVAHVNLGFRTDHLLTFGLPVPQGRLTDPKQITAFYDQLLERIRAVPGVVSVSASEGMPMQGVNFGMPFQIAGKEVSDMSQRPGAGFSMVTPDYFKVFGIQFVKGRGFTPQDIAGGIPVAVVNEAFVKHFLPNVDPLAQRILVEQLIPGVTKLGPPIAWQIVGVYKNVHNGGPRGDGFEEMDVPFAQSPWPQASIAIRSSSDPAALSKTVGDVVQSMDPNLPLANVKTMDQIVDESMSGDRFAAFLFGGFAAVALLLAALGIYGVMSFAVAQRTHEIGLRMALGAGAGRVLALILREGMVLAGIGLVLGIAGAYFVGRGMHSLFYEVKTIDPIAFGAVALLLILSALLACFVPARRATRVDPMLALREE